MSLFDERDLEDRLYKRKVESASLERLKDIALVTLEQLRKCPSCYDDLRKKMDGDKRLREHVSSGMKTVGTPLRRPNTECFAVILELQDKGCGCDSELPDVWQYLDTVEEPHVVLETELAESFQHRWANQKECQWSKKLSQPFFDMVVSGEKTVEGRLRKGEWSKMKVGDLICFQSDDSDRTVIVRVVGISDYDNFTEMLSKTLEKTLPGMDMSSALGVYDSIYGDEQHDYDVIGVEMKVVSRS